MSRGPGRVQQAILAYLAANQAADVRTIAAAIEGGDRWELPESVINSYRRGLRKLEQAGRVVFFLNRSEQRRTGQREWYGEGRRTIWQPRYTLSEKFSAEALAHAEGEAARLHEVAVQRRASGNDAWAIQAEGEARRAESEAEYFRQGGCPIELRSRQLAALGIKCQLSVHSEAQVSKTEHLSGESPA